MRFCILHRPILIFCIFQFSNFTGQFCDFAFCDFAFSNDFPILRFCILHKRAILHTSQANGEGSSPPAPPGHATGYVGEILSCALFLIHRMYHLHSRRRRGGRGGGRPPIRFETSKIWANCLFIWAVILFIWAHDWQKTVSVSVMTFFFFGEHLSLDRKTIQFSVKTFFFFLENTSILTEKPSQF